MYRCLYIDSKLKSNVVSKYIEEIMKCRGEMKLLEEWHLWKPPLFPVSGKDLKDYGCTPGKTFTMILDNLKNRWKESDFNMSKESLLEHLPVAIEEVSLVMKERKNKKRSPSPVKP